MSLGGISGAGRNPAPEIDLSFTFCGRVTLGRLERRWCNDGRNGEITVGDLAFRTLRQLCMADVDRSANVKACNIDLDVIRDFVIFADELKFVTHDVQNTTALQTR